MAQPISIATADGACPAYLCTPPGGARGPGILFCMDAGGIRPAAIAMAQRLADAGFVVLLPDLYYRHGPYGPFDPRQLFKGDARAVLGPLMASTGTAAVAAATPAFIAALDACPALSGPRIGAVGFCMGGGLAIAAGAACPDRIAAIASFHGGGLATDAPDSPHLLLPRLAARLYVATATADPSYPPDMATRFEAALDAARIRYRTETYQAAHGWMTPDVPACDETQADRGWRAMLAFFTATLPD